MRRRCGVGGRRTKTYTEMMHLTLSCSNGKARFVHTQKREGCAHRYSAVITAPKGFSDSIILILKPHLPPPLEVLSALTFYYSLTLSKKHLLAYRKVSESFLVMNWLAALWSQGESQSQGRFSLYEQILILMSLFYFTSYAILAAYFLC